MHVEYRNFDIAHIPDNEIHYFELLASIIENVDKYSYFIVTKTPTNYIFRISTSSTIINPLIKQLNIFNNANNIRTEYSKSIKSGNIHFKISLT